ncbi:MAG: shikimate kinase [Oscillospiraceae bacterium]
MIKKNKPVYLCGFMGCGKSTVGKLLAKKLGKDFIDLDDYIEQREGMTIPEIFEQKGEPYFRQKECEYLADLPASAGVVATGGGTLLKKENGDLAKSLGTVVYIDAPFELCYNRIKDDRNRPIAFNSTREQLLERFEQRKPLYIENSEFSVNGSGTPMQIVNEIIG